MAFDLAVKRIHEPPGPDDGQRVLVDRIWPRGVGKEHAALTLWLKKIAPSDALRKWFGHEPERWRSFRSGFGPSWMEMRRPWHRCAVCSARGG